MPQPKKKFEYSQLVDWLEGLLSEEEARAVEEHVDVADVAWLRKVFRVMEETVLEPPPPEVRRTLIARFKAYAEGRRTPGLLKRVVATLAFDSGLGAPVSVRTGTAQDVRKQLIYSTDALAVVLNFWPRYGDNNLDLEGQVFPREAMELGAISVQLLREEKEVAITATGDFGGFAFESVPPGVYTAILTTDRVEALITPVELY
jgi:hypothetical protein